MYYVFSLQAELSNGSLTNKRSNSRAFFSKEKAVAWYRRAVDKLCSWMNKSESNTGKCTLIEAGDVKSDGMNVEEKTGNKMKILEETNC